MFGFGCSFPFKSEWIHVYFMLKKCDKIIRLQACYFDASLLLIRAFEASKSQRVCIILSQNLTDLIKVTMQ